MRSAVTTVVPPTGKPSSSEVPRAGNRLPAISNRARRLPGVLNTVNSVTVKEADMKSKLLSGIALFMLSAAAMAQQSFSTPDPQSSFRGLKKTTTTAKLSLFRVMLVRVQSLTVLKKRLSKQAHQNFTLKTSTRNLLTNISFPQ